MSSSNIWTLLLLILPQFALTNNDSLLLRLSIHPDDTTKVLLMANSAESIQSSDPELADSLNHAALALSKKLNFPRGITFSLSNLTSLYVLNGDYSKAERSIDELLEIADDQEDLDLKIRMLNRLAVVQYYQGEFQKGIQTNLSILDALSVSTNHKSKLYAFNNIGINYEQLGETDKALEYYQLALEKARNQENIYAQGAIAGNMGVIYTDLMQLDKAKNLIQESIIASEKVNNQNLYVDETYNLAEIFILEEEYSEASRANKESRKTAELITDRNGILKAISQNGRISFYQKRYNEAASLLEESLKLSKEIGDKEHRVELYDYLNKSYSAIGELDKAYQYLTLYTIERDTVYNIEKTNELNRLEVQYQVAEKEKELLSNQIEIERKTAVRNQLLSALLLLLVITGSIIFIMRFRIRKNKLLAEQNLMIQNQKINELEREKKILSMAAMIDGQEAERIRIAKDLHDGLGGLLTTVKAQMSAVEKEITKLQNLKLYEKSNAMIDQACSEVRRISQNLMPSILRLEGLRGAVEDIGDQLSGVHGLKVDVQLNIDHEKLSETQEMFIYRIIQELTNNIVKHANANNVMIQINDYEDHLNMIIEDDGSGFDFEKTTDLEGIGLKSIHSRVDHLKGDIEFLSKPSEGTSVAINIPYSTQTI